MLDVQGTIARFSYNPSGLKRYSEKPILIICDYCSKSHETLFCRYAANKDITCGSKDCRNKLIEKTCLAKYGTRHHLASAQVKNKRKNSNIAKYGVDHVAKLDAIKEKIKKANLATYAEKDANGNCVVLEKIKQTNQIRYGTDYSINSPEIKEKAKETTKRNYGTENPFASPEIIEAVELTNLTKYGAKNPFQSPEIQKKIKTTNLLKYGTENPSSSSTVRKNIIDTNLAKYGVPTHLQAEEVKERIKATNLIRYGAENPFGSPECIVKARETKLERYGTAHPNNCYGKTEKEIADWLYTISGKKFTPNFKLLEGKEVDLYNEELKLGIEYCGLYWHTEDSKQKRTKNYHADKLKKLNAQDIRLITIFEDEWLYRTAQVKNFLQSVLGIYERTIYARKTTVLEVPPSEAQLFFDNYHIQGKNTLGRYFAGLYLENELLAVMSFGRHHRKNTQVVLDRFAVKTGVHLPGGASKLFSFLLTLSRVSEVISWSDNRWSEGNVYRQLGFSLVSALAPDYSYVDFSHSCRRVSKQSQRKSKTKCPVDMTEKEYANSNNLHRIWDCGKLRWLYCKQ